MCIIALAATIEISLRVLGFSQGAVYVADPDYEYMHAPNQQTRPFGNLLETNQFGMRSRAVASGDDVHALVIGDSVINGGNPMPQEALATTILEKDLQARLGPHARVLNISGGSWGPDNAAAFLRKRGLFGAHAIVAVFSSHDLGDIMTHAPIVDRHPSYQSSRSKLAILDTWTRYGSPRLKGLLFASPNSPDDNAIDKFTGQVNPGWLELRNIAQIAHIPLHVVLHKTRAEFLTGDFNAQGHQLVDYLRSLEISPVFEVGFVLASYRDDIHLSARGHADLAHTIWPLIEVGYQ